MESEKGSRKRSKPQHREREEDFAGSLHLLDDEYDLRLRPASEEHYELRDPQYPPAPSSLPRSRTYSTPTDPPPYGLSGGSYAAFPHEKAPRKSHHLGAPQSRTTLPPPKPAGSLRSVSTGTPIGRQGASTKDAFQPFPKADAPWPSTAHSSKSKPVTATATTASQSQRTRKSSRVHGGKVTSRRGDESASESGASVMSGFGGGGAGERAARFRLLRKEAGADSEKRRSTTSPLRDWARWMTRSGKEKIALLSVVAIVLIVKCAVGLGNYSGAQTPPMRGDFEAQRHWLALTSSALPSVGFLHSPTNESVPLREWYKRDLPYWGLDYPPLTAYHSFILGTVARLSSHTAPFVTLRPNANTSTAAEIQAWSNDMATLEAEGDLKSWMRATVLVSDAIVWIPAVLVYCKNNYGQASGSKGIRNTVVAAMTILLQPALLLIDNGHFQYNSVMLGFTLWSVNLFQMNHHLLGAVAFVLSLGFKQMALYYSPAIFAYLLGRCLWLGGRQGVSFLIRLGFTTILAFLVVFLPFLTPPSLLLTVIQRIFPFARGLFEDKVANAWCVLNIVIKLRNVASVGALAKLALLATLTAFLPGLLGMLWVSYEAGKRDNAEIVSRPSTEAKDVQKVAEEPKTPPTVILLPHSLFTSAMAFFLFSFQVHEKSILLPLMPLTLLMGGREAGHGRMDWEWAVLINNTAVFSMWPLLKRDGLGLQYLVLTLGWNFIIGYNPLTLRTSFVKWFSLLTYSGMFALHFLELLTSPPAHLPDLFTVFNLTLSAGVFGIGFLWASKRSTQEGWTVVGGFDSG